MNKIFFFTIMWAVLLSIPLQGSLASDDTLDPNKPTTWVQSSSRDFGCMLESKLGSRNDKYNCSTKKSEIAEGDVCKDTTTYYAGPEFPQVLVKKINPSIESIQLAWEHASLQQVTLQFKKDVSKASIKNTFLIDPSKAARKNVQSISIQKCSTNSQCLVIVGFDHLGAGDADCDGQ